MPSSAHRPPVAARAGAFARRAATYVMVGPLRFYRRFLSPLKPATCRFHPTCSQYAIEALERHGPLRGPVLAVWRLLRCQPLCEGGSDPVPPPRSTARADLDPGPTPKNA